MSVSSSNVSSRVPKPPGNRANASDSLRNVTLRVKKYLKLISLGSPSMTTLGSTSIGRGVAAPKLRSAPAPPCPGPLRHGSRELPSAVVVRFVRLRPRGAEDAYLAYAAVRLEHLEGVGELLQRCVDQLHLTAVGAVPRHAEARGQHLREEIGVVGGVAGLDERRDLRVQRIIAGSVAAARGLRFYRHVSPVYHRRRRTDAIMWACRGRSCTRTWTPSTPRRSSWITRRCAASRS